MMQLSPEPRAAMIADDKPLTRCTCSAVRMTSRHISQAYDQALSSTGLRLGQYAMLRSLLRLGPIGVQGLADAMRLDRTTVGRNLRPLQRDGLVSVVIDPQDRRGRLLAVTDAGREALQSAEPLWAAAQDRLESRFGSELTRQLHQTFASILALDLS